MNTENPFEQQSIVDMLNLLNEANQQIKKTTQAGDFEYTDITKYADLPAHYLDYYFTRQTFATQALLNYARDAINTERIERYKLLGSLIRTLTESLHAQARILEKLSGTLNEAEETAAILEWSRIDQSAKIINDKIIPALTTAKRTIINETIYTQEDEYAQETIARIKTPLWTGDNTTHAPAPATQTIQLATE